MRRFQLLLAAGLALSPLGACGNLTSGGIGEVEVYAVGDDAQSDANAALLTSLSPPGSSDADLIEGTINFRVRISILSDDGNWEELTNGLREGTLTLEGTDETELASSGVPAGRYSRVRMVFSHIQAEVIRGLNVDGEIIVGSVPVYIPPGTFIVVEEPLDLLVEDGGIEAILLDMNAQLWLRRFDRMRRRVDERDFRDAVHMRARTGGGG